MTPKRDLLLQQATACRQLAMIADVSVADRLKRLAAEYETLALVDQSMPQRVEAGASTSTNG